MHIYTPVWRFTNACSCKLMKANWNIERETIDVSSIQQSNLAVIAGKEQVFRDTLGWL